MTDPVQIDQERGDVFLDTRGNGRSMRLSWHPEADIVVLSLWREETCAGTFRMPREDVGAFVDALVDGLRDAPGVHVLPTTSQLPQPTGGLGDTQVIPLADTGTGFTDWAFSQHDGDDEAAAN